MLCFPTFAELEDSLVCALQERAQLLQNQRGIVSLIIERAAQHGLGLEGAREKVALKLY